MRYRAAVFAKVGEPLVIDEVETQPPGPSQALVRVIASGICHSQIHNLKHPPTAIPTILGHEAAGVVEAAGAGVTHVKEGDHVLLTWLPRAGANGDPPPVLASLTWRRENLQIGTHTWSEYALLDERYLVPLAKDLPLDVTAIIGCAVMTGCGAVINTARVRKGESVAVFGAGGVGLASIQAAANIGANPIIAVDMADAKLEFAQRFGATHGVNASSGDPVEAVRELTRGGADYAFDAIGLPLTQRQALAATRPGVGGLREGGMAVLVGVPEDDTPTLGLRSMLLGQKTYKASLGGGCHPAEDVPRFVQWYRDGRLPLESLVTRRYRLDEINAAVDDLSKAHIFGRAIIIL